MSNQENDKAVFEVDALVNETYNSIANWHNEEPTKESLKHLALEIVENIAKATLKHVGLNGSDIAVYKDEETAKKIAKIKGEEA